ncbi:MAG: PH domain-containing protein [Sumerlaeia bacterium]
MSLLSGLMGNASEVKLDQIQEEFAPLLIPGEELQRAYRVMRDMMVFSNKRLILVDKQGVTGKKREYLSIPYDSVTRFSKESMGLMDLDAELKIWIRGESLPISKTFNKDGNVNEVYQVLAYYVLGAS